MKHLQGRANVSKKALHRGFSVANDNAGSVGASSSSSPISVGSSGSAHSAGIDTRAGVSVGGRAGAVREVGSALAAGGGTPMAPLAVVGREAVTRGPAPGAVA